VSLVAPRVNREIESEGTSGSHAQLGCARFESCYELGFILQYVWLTNDHEAWAREYRRERSNILRVLEPQIVDIQHIGSTAIPGVPAKPILDIVIGVRSFEEATRCVGPMLDLGYEYRGENGIARRHYFVKGIPRTHHVHVLEMDRGARQQMLLFRDFLLAQPDLAQEYAHEKVCLADAYNHDRASYQRAKDLVIARLLTWPHRDAGRFQV